MFNRAMLHSSVERAGPDQKGGGRKERGKRREGDVKKGRGRRRGGGERRGEEGRVPGSARRLADIDQQGQTGKSQRAWLRALAVQT